MGQNSYPKLVSCQTTGTPYSAKSWQHLPGCEPTLSSPFSPSRRPPPNSPRTLPNGGPCLLPPAQCAPHLAAPGAPGRWWARPPCCTDGWSGRCGRSAPGPPCTAGNRRVVQVRDMGACDPVAMASAWQAALSTVSLAAAPRLWLCMRMHYQMQHRAVSIRTVRLPGRTGR